MQPQLDHLASLHRDITEALDANDAVRIEKLVARRQELLEALERAFQDAPVSERDRHHAVIKDLQSEENDVLRRCLALRKELQAELVAGRRPSMSADMAQTQCFMDFRA